MTAEEDKTPNDGSETDEAERLRLRGNDAFSTGDWERAAELYNQSLSFDPISKQSAKVYSNMAAVLCKVGQYDDAADAAERATVVDPTWAKGWWRRGVVAELRMESMLAVTFYHNAHSLDEKNRVFLKALRACSDKLGLELELSADGGDLVLVRKRMEGVSISVHYDREEAAATPTARCWNRIMPGGFSPQRFYQWRAEQAEILTPSSEQWMGEGLCQWYMGMSTGLATLIYQSQLRSEDCRRRCQTLDQIRTQGSEDEYEAASWQLLGGKYPGNAMDDMLNGLTHLAGQYIMFDLGKNAASGDSTFVPVPSCLSFMKGHQMVAMYSAVANEALGIMSRYMIGNTKIFVSEGVEKAIMNACRFGNAPLPKQFKRKTPEQVVAYCRQQLRKGKTWGDGMRRFVSLNYRGTILFGICCHLVDALSEFYKHMKWARDFIALAEEEWHVKRDGDYLQKGSCFRASFQVNMLAMELKVYDQLRGNSFKFLQGAYPLIGLFQLARKAADAASSPFHDHLFDGVGLHQQMSMKVAFQRKPTAQVHSIIASVIKQCSEKVSDEDLLRLLARTGFIEADDTRSLFAIIVEHYRIAANAQLPDADDAAILWWGVAANMAGAPETDGFTLGEFRYAMKKADIACRARAVEFFGPDENCGGSYHTISTLVLKRYADEDDSFILPKLNTISRRNGIKDLEMGGAIICQNFGVYVKQEQRKFEKIVQKAPEVEKEHGMDSDQEGLSSLAVLCVRALHKEDCTFARGESDPATIVLKALKAGALGDEK